MTSLKFREKWIKSFPREFYILTQHRNKIMKIYDLPNVTFMHNRSPYAPINNDRNKDVIATRLLLVGHLILFISHLKVADKVIVGV